MPRQPPSAGSGKSDPGLAALLLPDWGAPHAANVLVIVDPLPPLPAIVRNQSRKSERTPTGSGSER
jgi:hypothetical protein